VAERGKTDIVQLIFIRSTDTAFHVHAPKQFFFSVRRFHEMAYKIRILQNAPVVGIEKFHCKCKWR